MHTLSAKLQDEYGSGFAEKNLRHMIKFAETFPNAKIVSALSRQLSWTHFRTLIYFEYPLKREFYTEMCKLEGWSTRTLQKKIDSMLYERTALSRKPDDLIQKAAGGKTEKGNRKRKTKTRYRIQVS